jgi:hypothetical protein
MSEPIKSTNPNQCPYCNKVFPRPAVCFKHMLKCKCKTVDSSGHVIPIPEDKRNPKFKCSCDKEYTHKKSLDRHQKECTTYQNTINANGANNPISSQFQNGNIYNHSFNTTSNNPVFNFNPVGSETFDHLTESDIEKVLQSGKCAFKELAHLMYANPANKNAYIINQKKGTIKFIKALNRVDIDVTEKVLNKVVSSVEDKLDEYIEKYNSDPAKEQSYLGKLLAVLSDEHAEGVHDDKNLTTLIHKLLLIQTVAKSMINNYEKSLINSSNV